MSAPFVLPETAAVLEFLAAQEAPHLATLPAPEMRAVYEQLGEAFDLPAETGVRTADFEGAGLPLRAYFPGPDEAGPAIVYMHGGGWVIGDLETHHALCSLIARISGLRVVAVDYRLAPELPFPAAHEDCLAATEFVLGSPGELGAPVTGVAVAGDSAGGNLAFHVASRLGAGRLLGQFLIYPAGDCSGPAEGSYKTFEEGFLLDRRLMDRFIGDYLPSDEEKRHPDASPLLHPFPNDLPPAVIVTAGLDPLLDQGRDLAAHMAAQGIEMHYIEGRGLIHGMATMRKALPTGDRIIRRTIAMFAEMVRTAHEHRQEHMA